MYTLNFNHFVPANESCCIPEWLTEVYKWVAWFFSFLAWNQSVDLCQLHGSTKIVVVLAASWESTCTHVQMYSVALLHKSSYNSNYDPVHQLRVATMSAFLCMYKCIYSRVVVIEFWHGFIDYNCLSLDLQLISITCTTAKVAYEQWLQLQKNDKITLLQLQVKVVMNWF